MLIPDDVSVTNLLVDCRVEQECSTRGRSVYGVAAQRDFLVHRHTQVASSMSHFALNVRHLGAIPATRPHNPIIHHLQILITVLRRGQLGILVAHHVASRICNDKLVRWHAVVDRFTLII